MNSLSFAETGNDLRTAPETFMDDVTPIILAAGRGERLRPVTDHVPKALLPVRGEPLLDYHLRQWRALGIYRAIVVVGYRAQVVREHLNRSPLGGLPALQLVEQSPPRGTGDALKKALEKVRTDWVAVDYSDVYWGPEPTVFRQLLSGRVPRMAAAQVPDGSAYGRLDVWRHGGHAYLERIREKDGLRTPGLVNAGLYLLPRTIGTDLERVGLSCRGEVELTEAVEAFSRRRPVEILIAEGWHDIGTPERWREAEEGLP